MSGPAMARTVAVVEARDPGHDRAVAEPQDQFAATWRPAALADDDADEIANCRSRSGMKSISVDRAVGGLEAGFQDQRVRRDSAG